MEPFSLIHTALEGISLIEASAGTGKTYAIEGLFLRLLLEKQIPVEQILAVTFTQAATEELKDRIRNKIGKAKDAFLKGQSDDTLIAALLKKIKPAETAVQLLQDALTDFDQASIFTIHGFCQRVLHENAFETGTLFDTELISDQTKLVGEIADDFWRRHFYDAPPEFVSYALEKVKGPVYFATLLENVLPAAVRVIPEAPVPDWESLSACQKTYNRLKSNWPLVQGQVIASLKDPALSGTVYGSTIVPASEKKISKRDLKVSAMCIRLERFLGAGRLEFPLFKDFEKLTRSKIIVSTRKGKRPPGHPFFVLCDEFFTQAQALQKEMDAYLLHLKVAFFEYAASELIQRKKSSNVRFFDDLLLTLKDALDHPEGNILAETIRAKYQAALIDEFQDTDAIQYQIFSKIFSSSDSIFFMIGDPKQAIYSFRGADIFSYITASQNADSQYTLSENWRSSPGLIKAINTIFRDIPVPFVLDEISYIHTQSAHDKLPEKDNRAPMQLWFVSGSDESPLSKAEAIAMISNQLALEIIRILSEEGDRFNEGDIAILVRTNRQARIVKACLAQKQIPSVLYYAGNVFDTHEAMEMQKILRGIFESGSESKLKAALATDIMGHSAENIRSFEGDPQGWERRNIWMKEYFQLWDRYGFMRMFRFFMDREGVRERLLSLPDGERRLTNLLHLVEILHQESVESGPGAFGLIKWLFEQCQSSLPGPEAYQLRLESDARAVKIVTIHKSKGLEYPIVFCPFLWEGIATRNETLRFHQPGSKMLTLDLQPDKKSPHFIWAQNELLAESIRLLYVAITRAKQRCYLVWGRLKSADTSALMYLFHAGGNTQSVDRISAMQRAFLGKTASDMLSDLQMLEHKSEGSIQTLLLPLKADGDYAFQPKAFSQPVGRKFLGKIDTSWKISSYSSLISRQTPVGELPEQEAFFHSSWHDKDLSADLPGFDLQEKPADISLFPRGTRAGTFIHDIFEHLDFASRDFEDCEDLVEALLKTYGFEPVWKDTICRMVHNVLNVKLPGNSQDLVLASLPPAQRTHEMEFYFPVRSLSPHTIRKIFGDHAGGGLPEAFPEQMESLTFSPAKGFMKGFIDLIFQHRGQFYIVDWKSNYLGPGPDAYQREKLAGIMGDSFYPLQYHIYILALQQYLRLRIPGYRYETDFGGVYYLFCRGIDPRRGANFGIFHDRPAPGFIHELEKALIPGLA